MSDPSDITKPASNRIRLDYLDGIRAICALAVLAGHMGDGNFYNSNHKAPPLLQYFVRYSVYDRLAVALFIVLSGYCLMLPLARSGTNQVQGGILTFMKRRARRILPPYYAAIVFSFFCAYFSPSSYKHAIMHSLYNWGFAAHLLLIHNLRSVWEFQIDGPLWSVATEWDIYWLFVFILLPILRKSNITITIISGLVIGLIPHFFFHKWLDAVAPWYLGIFAMGMGAALMSFSQDKRFQLLRERVRWKEIAGALFVSILLLIVFKPAALVAYPLYLLEPYWGISCACMLVYCTKIVQHKSLVPATNLVKVLEWPPLVKIGLFSYSLYLTHAPVIAVIHGYVVNLKLEPNLATVYYWSLSIPICILLAWVFHIGFERPFMNQYQHKRTDTL